MRFDLPRVHGQRPGTVRGAEPTAGSSFVIGNYVTGKTTLTRPRLRQHPSCHRRISRPPVSSYGVDQHRGDHDCFVHGYSPAFRTLAVGGAVAIKLVWRDIGLGEGALFRGESMPTISRPVRPASSHIPISVPRENSSTRVVSVR